MDRPMPKTKRSEAIKAGLAAAKEQGVVLGTPENLSNEHRRQGNKRSAAVRARKAKKLAEAIIPIVEKYWVKHDSSEFDSTFENVAVLILESKRSRRFHLTAWALNKHGLPGPRGRPWNGRQVSLSLKLLLPKGGNEAKLQAGDTGAFC